MYMYSWVTFILLCTNLRPTFHIIIGSLLIISNILSCLYKLNSFYFQDSKGKMDFYYIDKNLTLDFVQLDVYATWQIFMINCNWAINQYIIIKYKI